MLSLTPFLLSALITLPENIPFEFTTGILTYTLFPQEFMVAAFLIAKI